MADAPSDPVLDPTNAPVIQVQDSVPTPEVTNADTPPTDPVVAPASQEAPVADPATTPAEVPTEPVADAPVDVQPVAKRGRKGKVDGTANVNQSAAGDSGPEYVKLPQDVSSNVSELDFPTDQYGYTSELKKAGLATISRLSGDADKLILLEDVLLLLLSHARARQVSQAAENQRAIDAFNTSQATRYGAGGCNGYQAS